MYFGFHTTLYLVEMFVERCSVYTMFELHVACRPPPVTPERRRGRGGARGYRAPGAKE